MMRLKLIQLIFLTIILVLISVSCSGGEQVSIPGMQENQSGIYTVYIVNNNLHTGIIIPVNSVTSGIIPALKYFQNSAYADFGWGEEVFYQNPSNSFCLGARAILLPNTSVIRVEGYKDIEDISVNWNDFTIRLELNAGQFSKLAEFLNKSFLTEPGNDLTITSKKRSGNVIFFKSVYRYYLFNTCNTWVAKALNAAGFDVSPFFIITRGQLYDEIKNSGTVLKPLK